VQQWLAAAEISSGPILRPVVKGQRILPMALTPCSVANIIKGYCEAIGLDPAQYAGHSLRAGYITSAAESGAQSFRIADHSRHKSLEMLRTYVRHVQAFRDHSGERFLWQGAHHAARRQHHLLIPAIAIEVLERIPEEQRPGTDQAGFRAMRSPIIGTQREKGPADWALAQFPGIERRADDQNAATAAQHSGDTTDKRR
jgi:hypothetical protein